MDGRIRTSRNLEVVPFQYFEVDPYEVNPQAMRKSILIFKDDELDDL